MSAFKTELWVAREGACTRCGHATTIQLHQQRPLQLLTERLLVIEKDRRCSNPACSDAHIIIRPDDETRRLVVKGCEYGLDVIALLGERHLQAHCSFAEIRRELVNKHGVLISERHVSNLFRIYLALVGARTMESQAVQARIKVQGRTILSVDAVKFDDVSPRLYVVREVLSQEILIAERIEIADTDRLAAFLNKANMMGLPILGIVSDKEHALVAAIKKVFPEVPHQYCQTHFLGHIAKPMESDLANLGTAVEKVAKEVRAVAKGISDDKVATPEERRLASKVCEAVQVISKVRGDKLLDPPALKRFTELKGIEEMTHKAVIGAPNSPLLTRLLGIFAILSPWVALAKRLSRQVTIVREIAHLLGQEVSSEKVKGELLAYLEKLEKESPRRGRGAAQGHFHDQVIAVTRRFWTGLLACYDVEGLPNNNNALESFFRALKYHFRRVHGTKSTAGGVLESIAPLVVLLWPDLHQMPDLEALLRDLSAEQLQRARDGIQELAQPARERRSFRRNRKGQLESAFTAFTEQTKGQRSANKK